MKWIVSVILVLVASIAIADVVPGTTDGEMVFKDGAQGMAWYDATNVPYVRTQIYTPGYYSYGYYYQPSYHWRYVKIPSYVAPAVTYKEPPPYSPNWMPEMIRYANYLDDRDLYEKLLTRITPARPNLRLQQYGYSYGYASNYATPNLGTYGVNANTTYGYSAQTLTNAYGDLNLNTSIQAVARGRDQQIQAGVQSQTELGSLVDRIVAGQGRNAQLIAEAIATRIKLDAARPTGEVNSSSTFRGTVVTPGSIQPPPIPQLPNVVPNPQPMDPANIQPKDTSVDDAKEFLKVYGIPLCGSCHTPKDGKEPSGKFSILDYPTMSQTDRSARVWPRLIQDSKEHPRMPLKEDRSGPAEPLNADQLRAFFTIK